MGGKMWSPFHLARRLFKPVPSLSSRADRLANWRAVLGFFLVIILNAGVRPSLDIVRDDIYLKAVLNSALVLLVALPLSFLIMLTITKKGRRRALVRGMGRGLRRLVVFGVAVVGTWYLFVGIHVLEVLPGVLQLFAFVALVWLFAYWACGSRSFSLAG